jgi:hypothetical protein
LRKGDKKWRQEHRLQGKDCFAISTLISLNFQNSSSYHRNWSHFQKLRVKKNSGKLENFDCLTTETWLEDATNEMNGTMVLERTVKEDVIDSS